MVFGHPGYIRKAARLEVSGPHALFLHAADIAREHFDTFMSAIRGDQVVDADPTQGPTGRLRVEPHSPGLDRRIWWGAGSNATAVWAGKLGLNLQSSTLKNDETGEPFHVQQAKQIRAYREACVTLGLEVDLHRPDGTLERVTATGVDDDGRLVVDGPAGSATVAAGDVQHVRAAGVPPT